MEGRGKKAIINLCVYFMQGRCRFGNKCHFSHQKVQGQQLEALMIRHAESEYNKAANDNPTTFWEQSTGSKQNLKHKYIDCSLSLEGQYLCQTTKLPQGYLNQHREVDIVFVSPLNRTLQTAQILINSNQLKVKRVIVLPQLSEVLSKICDFSGPLHQKIAKYKHFDFSEMERLIKQTKLSNYHCWQDHFVDREFFHDILGEEQHAFRYMKILENIFPTPLESSQRCFDRAMRALDRMGLIAEKLQASKVLLVSHNRILKYIDGRYSKGRARRFENCQIRRLML